MKAHPQPKKDETESDGEYFMHPKQVAVLNEMSKLKPDEKAVIFSEWTSVLDIMCTTLLRLQ